MPDPKDHIIAILGVLISIMIAIGGGLIAMYGKVETLAHHTAATRPFIVKWFRERKDAAIVTRKRVDRLENQFTDLLIRKIEMDTDSEEKDP